ncbi:extracellular solute-binding protein [Bifidobacterium imperatoris]|uniref:Extracellular solute-binding protein n=1 Tax=Bifidobacterium imperatoris TaxID=2020965 RepID=A0A2N5IQ31_9BIFI|nr:extracellular solute-binding protein [Bifidobacterium imperatoris]PLS24073.1 Maltodextrin-binding protein [Bifidobacterium imperatoris]QSY58187.1 extracellular solute-binding protein [Bifidobacterium imperatoris]
MKLTTKKCLAATVAIAALVSPLAACGGGNASSGGKTTISFYSYFKENQIGDVIKGFEKANPDIKVDAQYGQDAAQYVQTLQTRLAGGAPPTVFNLTMDNRTDVMGSGAALDITGEDFLDGIDESNFTLFKQDDKVYGMPVSVWVGTMFYNKDILSEAGYDEFPTSWDDFIALGKKVNATGKNAYLEELNSPASSFIGLLASKYAAEGNKVQDEVIWNGESTFSKEWTDVAEEWQKGIKAGVVPQKSVGLSADQIKQEFMTGNLLAYRTGPWDLEDLRASGVNFGVAPMPAYKDGEAWITGGPDQGFAISSKANEAQQEAAKKFLAYLNSEEGLKTFTTTAGTMSLSTKYESEAPDELKEVVNDYFLKNKFYWVNWGKAATTMSTEMAAQQQLLVQGKISPADFTKAMDAKWAEASK